ncbi:MAG: 30S ribosomal protein S6 [Deltaproteobacteria bacterium]|nr:30S ribosomal protein S6 [Deltaproteobacteria bacterium]
MRRYETIFIVRADLQSDETGDLIGRYAGIIEGMDGTIVKIENWGKRRLAYPIEKRREGVYVRIDFVAQYKVVSEVERNFKIDDNILRFQTVKLSDRVDMEEVEREIADAHKREEEQKKEEARKREEDQKKEAVSEPAHEEVEPSEGANDHDAGTGDEESAQDSSPAEADAGRAKEE